MAVDLVKAQPVTGSFSVAIYARPFDENSLLPVVRQYVPDTAEGRDFIAQFATQHDVGVAALVKHGQVLVTDLVTFTGGAKYTVIMRPTLNGK